MAKKFIKNIEDFTCEHCGKYIKGNGFTNHCPDCLFSKHVDINPGDRENLCQGMMKPVGLEIKHDEYVIVHKCQKCGFTKKNKSAPDDNFELLVSLSKNPRVP